MNWPDFYLLCFGVGSLWSLASLLLGGIHLGHGAGGAHAGGHAHVGHHGGFHAADHGTGVHHGTAAGHHHSGSIGHGQDANGDQLASWIGSMLNPSCVAVFLAWFGGIGYLLTRHSGFSLSVDLSIAVLLGLVGAWMLAAFLRFLSAREQPMNPADYEMVGVLGRVTCSIRPGGVGEVIYVRDGARKPLPARSEDGVAIGRDEEVVVTRYEKGIAFVRTWEAITQSERRLAAPKASPKETENVE
jgi:membrane protein implicated in regulation of membrane protease activity